MSGEESDELFGVCLDADGRITGPCISLYLAISRSISLY